MQDDNMVRMELKYCECCGGLLLRRVGSGASYCSDCAARVRELAPPRGKRRGRPPKAQAAAQLSLETPCCSADSATVEPSPTDEPVEDIQAVADMPPMKPACGLPNVAGSLWRTA